jgi:hypothetical protein
VKPVESQIEASIDSSHDPQRNGGEKTPVRSDEDRARDGLKRWQITFLDAYRACGVMTEACRRAKVSRSTVQDHKANDPLFAQACAEAFEEVTDGIEKTTIEQARDGVLTPVFYRGEECAIVREFDHGLQQFMLKTRRREVYGERLDVSVTSLSAHVHFDAKQLVAEFDRLIPALAGTMVESEAMAGNGQKESPK